MLAFVRGRIIIGVGAWLLGAGAATGGSLLAVSLIGQGMAGFATKPMTAAAVASAARAHSGERESTSPLAGATSPASPGPATTAQATPSLRASSRPSAAPRRYPSPDPASPTATAVGSTGTVLTSLGGNVVAGCEAAGAYLISWSPQQGYETGEVQRGPAVQAQVTFESPANSVVMVVTCQAGEPQASSSVQSGNGSTDE